MYVADMAIDSWLLPRSVTWAVCVLLVSAGLIFTYCGVGSFRRRETTVNPNNPERASVLVTAGVYSISRNPMYVGFLLLLLAWGVLLPNPASIIIIGLFFIYIDRVQIVREEAALSLLFGESYSSYKIRVRRWL